MMKSNLLVRLRNIGIIILMTFLYVFTAECDPVNFAIRGVLIPILAIAGTIANLLTIRVFNNSKMKSPIHTILVGRYSYKSNKDRILFNLFQTYL